MAKATYDAKDPRILACIELLSKSGLSEFQMRYSDDEEPTLWLTYGKWRNGAEQAAGGLTPLDAAFNLLQSVMTGGVCAHCGKSCGVSKDWEDPPPDFNGEMCWWIYDPELKEFRRSCAGETEGRAFGIDREGNPVGRNDPCPCGSGEKWKHCHGA